MKVSNCEQDKLQPLEESLWRPETRFNRSYMKDILDKDFFEFGRSGRTYTRAECLDIKEEELRVNFPLENFKVHYINENIVLVTYVSEVIYETVQRANRSSLWVKNKDKWKLRFHQGTPLK